MHESGIRNMLILERYVKNQIIVPNEAREQLGMPQRPGGDEPLQLKPDQAADATANRSRDAERTNNNSDSTSTVAGRNPKGEGRKFDEESELSIL